MVTYTDPTAGDDAVAIEDAAGNETRTFTTGRDGVPAVTNNSTVAPVPTSAAVAADGNSLTVTFDESVDQTNLPAAAAFSVEAGGAPVTVSGVSAGTAAQLVLALAAPGIGAGQVVTLGYTDPTTGDDTNAVQDTSGNDAASFSGFSVTNNSTAGTAVPDNSPPVTNNSTVPTAAWPLKPAGLTAGDQFRLLFLSSTKRNAQATDIATYNTFIQNLAAAGHADIRDYSTGFRAVGCTSAVDARDNTLTTYVSTAKGVPIYWLGGTKAADEYEDFYDGSWDDEANDKNASGNDGPDTSQASNSPLTGCEHDGTEALDGSISQALGASEGSVIVGRPNNSTTGNGPLSSTSSATPLAARPMYGLSQVFQVVDTTPPTLTRAVVTSNGLIIQLEFSENVDQSNLPPAAAFEVTAGGSPVTVSGVISDRRRPHWRRSGSGGFARHPPGPGRRCQLHRSQRERRRQRHPGHRRQRRPLLHHRLRRRPPVTNNSTVTGTTAPGAPTGLMATASGNTRIDLSWTAPGSNGGSAITGYKIEISSDGGTSWSDHVANTSGTGTTYAHTGLSAGTTRHYRVSAINTNGASTASNVDGATTGTSAPGAPTSLMATASGNTRIDLSWTAPGSNGGSAITGYKIEISSDGGTSWSDHVANTSGTGTTYAHTGLAAGTTRHYRVSAINSNGAGATSNVAGTTTGTTVPGATTGLVATASGATRINLTWTAPGSDGGSPITGYKIEVSSDGGTSWSDHVANTNGPGTTYSHTGLAAGTTRHYRVSAINTNGAGAASNVDDATTGTSVPGAPTGLMATANGNTQIDLSWTAPASDGGSAITGYRIEISPNGNSSWTTHLANTSGTGTTYAHTGLAAGTTRHYRVSAINTNGAGAASNVDGATTGTTVPGAPTGLVATASGNTRINLSWTAPASDGGSPITGYKIEVSSDGGTSWSDLEASTNSPAPPTPTPAWPPAPPATTASRPSTPTAPAPPPASTTPPPAPPCPAPPPASRQPPAGPPGSTSPGPPPATPAAAPSPATGSRSPPMATPAGPPSKPTPTAPTPPTRAPASPAAPPATTASRPSTPTASARPPTSTTPPPAPACPTPPPA